ncbi:galactose-1-phosphate uridylyltransferase [Terrisporobacter sp.]
MKELATDTLNGSKVIISIDRKNRPIDNIVIEPSITNKEYEKKCPFCSGNEKYIEEETFIINKDEKWIVKSVKNKYPIIDDNELNKVRGEHDVIIDNYKHNSNFYNMSKEEFYYLLLIYKKRFKDLKEDKKIKFVCLFKNYLRDAGASLMHPHSQIISLPFVPPILEREYEICEEFYKKMGINMYDNLIKEELENKKRVIYSDDDFLVFIPEICRFTGDIVILLKDNTYFYDIDENRLENLSVIMRKLFTKLYKEYGNCPFNMYLHTHPVNQKNDYKNKYNVHFHIVLRKFNFGGFELSTGIYVSSEASEDIAEKLKFN